MIALPKVYIETTIPSFYCEIRTEPVNVARIEWTKRWWDEHLHEYEAVTSEAVLEELNNGDYPTKEAALALANRLRILPVVSEVEGIVDTYIERAVMPRDPRGDALHLALASFYSCDFLLTWNCKHLANANKFRAIRQVNEELKLAVPEMATPMELLGVEAED